MRTDWLLLMLAIAASPGAAWGQLPDTSSPDASPAVLSRYRADKAAATATDAHRPRRWDGADGFGNQQGTIKLRLEAAPVTTAGPQAGPKAKSHPAALEVGVIEVAEPLANEAPPEPEPTAAAPREIESKHAESKQTAPKHTAIANVGEPVVLAPVVRGPVVRVVGEQPSPSNQGLSAEDALAIEAAPEVSDAQLIETADEPTEQPGQLVAHDEHPDDVMPADVYSPEDLNYAVVDEPAGDQPAGNVAEASPMSKSPAITRHAASSPAAEAPREFEIPTEVGDALQQARHYARQRQFTPAWKLYERQLPRLDAARPEVQRLLAPLLLEMQRPHEALVMLEALHRQQPDHAEIVAGLVQCYSLVGDAKQAIRLIDLLGQLPTEGYRRRTQLAAALAEQGDLAAAQLLFEQVLAADPDNFAAQLGMAQILLRSGQPTAAAARLDMLPSGGDQRSVLLAHGEQQALAGQSDGALAIFRQLVRSQPDDIAARLALAELHLARSEHTQAQAECAQALRHNPLHPQSRELMLRILCGSNKLERASELCRHWLKEEPTAIAPLVHLAAMQRRAGEPVQSLELCQRRLRSPIAQARESARLRIEMGHALTATGKYSEALLEHRTAQTLCGGRSAAALYGMYVTLIAAGDRVAARQTLLGGLQQLGELSTAQVALAQAAAAEGDEPLAANLLRAALNREPENAHARVQLATLTTEQTARPGAEVKGSPQPHPRSSLTLQPRSDARFLPRSVAPSEPRKLAASQPENASKLQAPNKSTVQLRSEASVQPRSKASVQPRSESTLQRSTELSQPRATTTKRKPSFSSKP